MNSVVDVPSGATDLPPIRRVAPRHVLRWVKLGWQDFRAAGWPSVLHGLIVFVASVAIIQVALFYWPLLPGAVSGFVLVGPILATGLYALSHSLERQRMPRLRDAISAWWHASHRLLRFGLLLILAGAAWVGVSVLLFGFFVDAEIGRPSDFLEYVVVQNEVHFLLWTILGGMGTALMFGMTVVSVPLLLDRDVGTKAAVLTSVRAVGENPITMGCWAIFLLIATGLSIATLMLGFVVLYPVMGHASWHVYRDLVDTSALPARNVGV